MAEPTMRADAKRNRGRILEEARVAFATEGPEVSLDEIARRAQVGAGTVHRHFPTKEALMTAVVLDRLGALSAQAKQLAVADDATTAFVEFVRELAGEAAKNLMLTTALGGTIGPEGAAAGADLSTGLGTLLVRAQEAEGIRRDVGVAELHAILGGVIAMERGMAPDRRGLGLDVVIDGLRA
jgi:AcrR family transcriptional regulator